MGQAHRNVPTVEAKEYATALAPEHLAEVVLAASA